MFATTDSRHAVVGGVLSVVLLGCLVSLASAATGSFTAVLNEQNSNGDSRRSVTFFDAADLSLPLFSVFMPFELNPGSGNFEELSAVTVDSATGDVYVIAFDSGPTGVDDGTGDIQGDLDLYKIPFATVYDHWAANFQGQDVRMLPNPNTWANPPSGTNNSGNLDYVTYGNTFDFHFTHSNTFALAGSVEKIGQINRGNGNSFFPFALDFIDQDNLIMLDDSIGLQSADDPLDDHTIRLVKRISSSPGLATSTTVVRTAGGTNYMNGGYNGSMTQAATESWGTFVVEPVGVNDAFILQLDGMGHSEPESIAYHEDSASGVRGVWITESDSAPNAPGDAVAFMELDANGDTVGYRPMVTGGSPFTLSLSNDPANGEDLMGKADNIFVDRDTGDLIVIESGFNDAADGVGPDHEPGVLRVDVNYDNGFGEIEFGTWDPKIILNPQKDPGDTFLERGHWSDYDSATDTVYFFNPGGGGDTPPFEMDIYALNLTTGVTTPFMNVDDSVSLFTGDSFGDKVIAFTLAAGIPGDHNGDGTVDAADYALWRSDPGSFGGAQGYTDWVNNFGAMAGSGAGPSLAAVPEPASAVLLLAGLAALCGRRRRTA